MHSKASPRCPVRNLDQTKSNENMVNSHFRKMLSHTLYDTFRKHTPMRACASWGTEFSGMVPSSILRVSLLFAIAEHWHVSLIISVVCPRRPRRRRFPCAQLRDSPSTAAACATAHSIPLPTLLWRRCPGPDNSGRHQKSGPSSLERTRSTWECSQTRRRERSARPHGAALCRGRGMCPS